MTQKKVNRLKKKTCEARRALTMLNHRFFTPGPLCRARPSSFYFRGRGRGPCGCKSVPPGRVRANACSRSCPPRPCPCRQRRCPSALRRSEEHTSELQPPCNLV